MSPWKPGQRHGLYLREHKRAIYFALLTSGKLNHYLADIYEQAKEMFSRLVKEPADKEGVAEKLKSKDQMLWVQRMSTVWETAMELVNNDLIYA